MLQNHYVPRILTYYTENTPYQKMALQLVGDCQELGLRVEAVAAPSLGSRPQNQRQKIFILKEFMDKSDEPFLWIDADSRVWKRPIGFAHAINNHIDFICYYRATGHWQGMKGGVMFFNNTPRVKKLLDMMVQIAECNPRCYDEPILKRACHEIPGLRYQPLNPNFELSHPYFTDERKPNTVIQVQYSQSLEIWGSSDNPDLWHPEDKRPKVLKDYEVLPALLPHNVPPRTLVQEGLSSNCSPLLNEKWCIKDGTITLKDARAQIFIPGYLEMKEAWVSGKYGSSKTFPELSYSYNEKVTEFKYYFQRFGSNVDTMPPLEVIFAPVDPGMPWKIWDGKKRLSALCLLTEEFPVWNSRKIKIRFYKNPSDTWKAAIPPHLRDRIIIKS